MVVSSIDAAGATTSPIATGYDSSGREVACTDRGRRPRPERRKRLRLLVSDAFGRQTKRVVLRFTGGSDNLGWATLVSGGSTAS